MGCSSVSIYGKLQTMAGVKMESLVIYAPYIIMFIVFCIQYKIFMTPADFQKEKASFIQYISEHYVSDNTYRSNHESLQKQVTQIHQDVSEVKTLLISIVNNQHNSRN